MPKKSLLFVTHSSDLAGGGEYDFLKLLNYYSNLRDFYKVDCLLPHNKNEHVFTRYCDNYGVYKYGFLPSHYHYGIKNYLRYLKNYFIQRKQIKNYIKNRHYNLIIINVTVLFWHVLILSRYKIPIVVFIRENIHPYFIRYIVYKIYSYKCSLLITNSDKAKNDYLKITGKNNVARIYPGIGKEENVVYKDNKYYVEKFNVLSSNSFKFLNIGSVNKLKNQKLILNAINQLKYSNNVPQVLFAGYYDINDKYYIKLKKYITKNKIQKYCLFFGNLSQDELFYLIRNIDATIIASISEGMPLSMIESMKFKKPVISTKVGGVNEIIDNMKNGILIENNSEDLANNMELISNNTELYKSISNESYNTYKKYFLLEKNLNITKKTIDKYFNV